MPKMALPSHRGLSYRPARWSQGILVRYVLAAIALFTVLYYLSAPQTLLQRPLADAKAFLPTVPIGFDKSPKEQLHPIDELIAKAESTFNDLLVKESKDVASAAAAYRTKRGRHPPPGFDVWFKFAQEHGTVMVEEFWDQIYHDLGPFWGVPPAQMKREAATAEMVINVRDKNATSGSDWFWTVIWTDLFSTIEQFLPDMDVALNAMDEVRMAVPWEDINKFMEVERRTRTMAPAAEVVDKYPGLPAQDEVEKSLPRLNAEWTGDRPFWRNAVKGCHPRSIARKAQLMTDFNSTPAFGLGFAAAHTYQGYVSNHTLATDYCHQPDLQGLHGSLINPLTVSTTEKLFPLFAGSKLPTTNEILLPAPMYWENNERFNGNEKPSAPWAKKNDKVIWRGVATGGRHNKNNWKGFQRHRFVAMTNASSVGNAESWVQTPPNFALPTSVYNVAAQQESRMGSWIEEWSDTGFVDLFCAPSDRNEAECDYLEQYYSIVPGQMLSEQYNNKYLPDVDGNSFSGRYRGFLMSTSLPIKATLYKEWHDSRLVPWKHFVPMDNRYMDFYGIMQYFLGYEGDGVKVAGHDKEAEKIALQGQEWANKVLRKEDMQVYTLRLLLEYARLGDERRDHMGWVGDLK